MLRRAVLLACLLCAAGGAWAHLMPQGQGTVRVDRDGVFAVVALPASVFAGADTDGNGRISLAELDARREPLLRQAREALDFRGDGERGRLLLEDLLIPHLHDPQSPPDTDYLIAMQRHVWDVPPRGFTLAARGEALAPRPLLVQAVRDGASEAVLLTPGYREHRFFAGATATLLRFVGLGAEHILGGVDHLLFLLTVLVAVRGWRPWLAVTSSFTLAHSATLSLSAIGWVAVSPAIAEPLIAASIIALAWHNLRSRTVALGRQCALVFACGLVHGLGFATALAELGGSGSRWLQLAGFNLGVEVGQLLFVAAALLALAGLRRAAPALSAPNVARTTSMAAAGIAGILLVRLLVP